MMKLARDLTVDSGDEAFCKPWCTITPKTQSGVKLDGQRTDKLCISFGFGVDRRFSQFGLISYVCKIRKQSEKNCVFFLISTHMAAAKCMLFSLLIWRRFQPPREQRIEWVEMVTFLTVTTVVRYIGVVYPTAAKSTSDGQFPNSWPTTSTPISRRF